MTDRERVPFLFIDDDDAPTRKAALLVAVLLHLLLLTVTLPSVVRHVPEPARTVQPIRVTDWTPPPPSLSVTTPQITEQSLLPRHIPIPQPESYTPEVPVEPGLPVIRRSPAPVVEAQLGSPVPPPPSSLLFVPGLDGVSYPQLIESTRVLPRYPTLARKAGLPGKVILEAVVLADGTVGDVNVLRSPGSHLGFEEAALEAVRQWRYRPGLQNGRPVAVRFTVVVEFVLE